MLDRPVFSGDSAETGSGGTERRPGPPDVRFGARRSALKKAGLLALCAAAVVCVLLVLHFEGVSPDGGPDFVCFYAAGKLLRQGQPQDLYQPGPQQRMEDQIFPHSTLNLFDHLPYEAWLYEQLAYLPYSKAYVVWGAFNLLLVGLMFYLLRFTGSRLDGNSRLVWLLVCLLPVAGTLVLGQDSIVLAFLFLLAYLALKQRRDFAAGLALGVGLFRFEILFPFAFIFLLRRRWKFLSGLLVMSVLVLLASVAVAGWSGLIDYAKLLWTLGHASVNTVHADSPNFMPLRYVQPTLRGFLAIFLRGVIPSAGLFLLVLAGTLFLLGWAAFEFKDVARPLGPAYDLEFSLAVFAALLSSYFLFIHELTPLILVAFLMLGYESAARRHGWLKDRAGTALFLLFALVSIVGAILGFRRFSVLFLVLLGLMIWLSQELSRLRKLSLSP